MVTKQRKEETVIELKDKFSRAKSVFTTTQLGLTVAQITALRNEIRGIGAEFKIAKNSLFKIASKGTDYEKLTEDLKGPSAFLFCYEDIIAPAGKVTKFSKANKNIISVGGAFLDGELLDAEGATKVASLPSKEVILSQIAGMLVQNTQAIAYILSQLGENADQTKLLKDLTVTTESVDASNSSSSAASAEGENKEPEA